MNIVLGVSGGIAAYKAVALARLLVEQGHDLHVVPTHDALKFVGLPTWEAISRNPVTTSVHEHVPRVRHVSLGQNADLVIVAPATANTIAKMSAGIADDLLGTTLLATRAPVLVAPAMHTEMWQHPATQHNVRVLADRGVHLIGPESGRLTGQDTGPGRMSEPADIAQAAEILLSSVGERQSPVSPDPSRDFTGVRVVVTAGGTREPIDPVRFLGNRSSGRQGIALAAAAASRGAQVQVIAANVDVNVLAELEEGTHLVKVSSAAEMQKAVHAAATSADVVVMAAAVADYKLANPSSQKLRKDEAAQDELTLSFVRTPDILRELVDHRKPGQTIVGFAAETVDESQDSAQDAELLEYGLSKLGRKGCDLLAVNQVGWQTGFEHPENSVLLLGQPDLIIDRVSGSKRQVADAILDAVFDVRNSSA